MNFIYSVPACSIYGYITNSQVTSSQLTLELTWLEHCTGIVKVIYSNPVQAWIFSGYIFSTAQVEYK